MAGRACVRKEGHVDEEEEEQLKETSWFATQGPLRKMTPDMSPSRTTYRQKSRSKLKSNGGQSSSWVGARRSLGRSPASFGVGHPAGGARTLAPVHRKLLCLPA